MFVSNSAKERRAPSAWVGIADVGAWATDSEEVRRQSRQLEVIDPDAVGVTLGWPGNGVLAAGRRLRPEVVGRRHIYAQLPGPTVRGEVREPPAALQGIPPGDAEYASRVVEHLCESLRAFGDGCGEILLSVGVEIDAFLIRDPVQIDDYQTMLGRVRDGVRTVLPGVRLGTTFAVTAFQNYRLKGVIGRFAEVIDWVGFVHYASGRSPVEERPGQERAGMIAFDYQPGTGYVTKLMDLLAWLSGDLPFAVVATALPAGGSWGGSEELQAGYVRELVKYVEAYDGGRLLGVLWDRLMDPTPTDAQEICLREFGRDIGGLAHSQLMTELVGTTGLFDSDGRSKPAATELGSRLRRVRRPGPTS